MLWEASPPPPPPPQAFLHRMAVDDSGTYFQESTKTMKVYKLLFLIAKN